MTPTELNGYAPHFRKALESVRDQAAARARQEVLAEIGAAFVRQVMGGGLLLKAGTWDESEHPRDHGKFSSKPGVGGGEEPPTPPASSQPAPTAKPPTPSAVAPLFASAAESVRSAPDRKAAFVALKGVGKQVAAAERAAEKAAFADVAGRVQAWAAENAPPPVAKRFARNLMAHLRENPRVEWGGGDPTQAVLDALQDLRNGHEPEEVAADLKEAAERLGAAMPAIDPRVGVVDEWEAEVAAKWGREAPTPDSARLEVADSLLEDDDFEYAVVKAAGGNQRDESDAGYDRNKELARQYVAKLLAGWDESAGGGDLFTKAAQHAPAGGVSVQGKEYKGGEFIPGEVMDRATDKEKAAVAGDGRPAGGGEAGERPPPPQVKPDPARERSYGRKDEPPAAVKQAFAAWHPTAEQKEALAAYTDPDDAELEGPTLLAAVRGGTASPKQQAAYRAVVGAVNSAPTLPEPVRVFRGFRFKNVSDRDAAVAKLAADGVYRLTGGVSSSSLDPGYAAGEFSDEDTGVVFDIETDRGAWVDPLAPSNDQREVLLPDGEFEVTAIGPAKVGRRGKTYTVVSLRRNPGAKTNSALFAKAAAHSPTGGVTIAGKHYPGGQFIPAAEMAKASPEEKAELERKQAGGGDGTPTPKDQTGQYGAWGRAAAGIDDAPAPPASADRATQPLSREERAKRAEKAKAAVEKAVADPKAIKPHELRALHGHFLNLSKEQQKEYARRLREKVGGTKAELADRLRERIKAERVKKEGTRVMTAKVDTLAPDADSSGYEVVGRPALSREAALRMNAGADVVAVQKRGGKWVALREKAADQETLAGGADGTAEDQAAQQDGGGMDPAEFDRRMAGVDPRDSGLVEGGPKSRTAADETDDHAMAARADAGAKRQRMLDWQADRPASVAAEDAVRRANGRVERAGGGGGERAAAGGIAPESAPGGAGTTPPATTPPTQPKTSDQLGYLPKDPKRLTVDQANQALADLGYEVVKTVGGDTGDPTDTPVRVVRTPAGEERELTPTGIRTLLYGDSALPVAARLNPTDLGAAFRRAGRGQLLGPANVGGNGKPVSWRVRDADGREVVLSDDEVRQAVVGAGLARGAKEAKLKDATAQPPVQTPTTGANHAAVAARLEHLADRNPLAAGGGVEAIRAVRPDLERMSHADVQAVARSLGYEAAAAGKGKRALIDHLIGNMESRYMSRLRGQMITGQDAGGG